MPTALDVAQRSPAVDGMGKWAPRLRKAGGVAVGSAIFVALAMLLLWPHISVTIEAGHAGVFFDRLRGGTVMSRTYGEGLHLFLPWNTMTSYDCRVQRQAHVVDALAQGGLRVEINVVAVWTIEPSRVNDLHVRIGPNYRERLIDPLVVSAVRNVVGNFQQENIYEVSAESRESMQEEALQLVRTALREDSPIHVIDIMIQRIVLPETLQAAISDKFAAEQRVMTERYRILQSFERFKRNYIDADAIRVRQRIVNPGLTENYLRLEGITATRELAASPNAKLVIMGGKDGLPLLLNPDAMASAPASGSVSGPASALDGSDTPPPAAAKAGESDGTAPADGEFNDIKLDYEEITRRLEELQQLGKRLKLDRALNAPMAKESQKGGLSIQREWRAPSPPPSASGVSGASPEEAGAAADVGDKPKEETSARP